MPSEKAGNGAAAIRRHVIASARRMMPHFCRTKQLRDIRYQPPRLFDIQKFAPACRQANVAIASFVLERYMLSIITGQGSYRFSSRLALYRTFLLLQTDACDVIGYSSPSLPLISAHHHQEYCCHDYTTTLQPVGFHAAHFHQNAPPRSISYSPRRYWPRHDRGQPRRICLLLPRPLKLRHATKFLPSSSAYARCTTNFGNKWRVRGRI